MGDSYSQMRSRLNVSLSLLGYDRLSETDSILYIYICIYRDVVNGTLQNLEGNISSPLHLFLSHFSYTIHWRKSLIQ